MKINCFLRNAFMMLGQLWELKKREFMLKQRTGKGQKAICRTAETLQLFLRTISLSNEKRRQTIAYAPNTNKNKVKIDVRLHFCTFFCPCKKTSLISRPLPHQSHNDLLLIRLEIMQFLVSHQSVALRMDFISKRIHSMPGLFLL